jgi:hypothetical protein
MSRTLREIMGSFLRKGDPGWNTVTGFDFTKDAALTRKRAIRAKCIECQNGQIKEIAICQMTDCSLWPWRMGKLVGKDPLPDDDIAENSTITDEADDDPNSGEDLDT